MKLTRLDLPGLALVHLDIYKDARGFFTERYRTDRFAELGLTSRFVQDNHSRSSPGVLRGLHYQREPPQGKLVGVIRGRIWDVVVDIRLGSPTLGKSLGLELSEESNLLLWIPAGFAHGFCVLGDEPADVMYKVDALYNPAGDAGIRWDDPTLAIAWPVQAPIVSDKDRNLENFATYTERLQRGA